MTIQELPEPLYYPHRAGSDQGPVRHQSSLIDADDEAVGALLTAPATGSITAIGWRTGTVTTGGDLDVRVETTDETVQPAVPSGTLWNVGSPTNATQAVLATEDDTWFVTTLTNAASVSRGDRIAVAVKRSAALGSSFNGNVVWFDRWLSTANASGTLQYPYVLSKTGASWAVNTGKTANFLIVYSGPTYYPIGNVVPFSNASEATVNTGTTPDEVGIIWQLPVPHRVTGLWHDLEIDADSTFKLYDSDGSTVLESVNWPANVRTTSTESPQRILFASSYSLSANTNYRLTIQSQSGSSIFVQYYEVDANAYFGQAGGINCYWTQRTDAGSWSQTNTRRPLMGLMIDGFDDGAGGGVAPAPYIIQGIGTY